ncbi:hypothetical protein HAX54_006193 [Datura stramonium]|uniref:Uncharacterized protein n=1 Tax=Datura stramonium TaxID=4076 RepID=A0ABS8T9W6_DATST|nr:hypothetical protein [Datura stramonium]
MTCDPLLNFSNSGNFQTAWNLEWIVGLLFKLLTPVLIMWHLSLSAFSSPTLEGITRHTCIVSFRTIIQLVILICKGGYINEESYLLEGCSLLVQRSGNQKISDGNC